MKMIGFPEPRFPRIPVQMYEAALRAMFAVDRRVGDIFRAPPKQVTHSQKIGSADIEFRAETHASAEEVMVAWETIKQGVAMMGGQSEIKLDAASPNVIRALRSISVRITSGSNLTCFFLFEGGSTRMLKPSRELVDNLLDGRVARTQYLH